MSTHIKARTATTVPMKDMRHVAINAGETVDLSEVKDVFRKLWEDGDRWLHSIFESTSAPSGADPAGGLVFEDPVVRAMQEHEALVRERVQLPREERQGAPDVPTIVTDRFRTLPTSGADLEADHRYAAGGADPKEGFDAEGKQAEEEDRLGHAAGSDDRKMPGDQPSGSSAASAADLDSPHLQSEGDGDDS